MKDIFLLNIQNSLTYGGIAKSLPEMKKEVYTKFDE